MESIKRGGGGEEEEGMDILDSECGGKMYPCAKWNEKSKGGLSKWLGGGGKNYGITKGSARQLDEEKHRFSEVKGWKWWIGKIGIEVEEK